MRHARARELLDRALASGEATLQPESSILLASLLLRTACACIYGRQHLADSVSTPGRHIEIVKAIWRAEPRALELAQRALALLAARWRAGSLFTLTSEERAYWHDDPAAQQTIGGALLLDCAEDAVGWWPTPLPTPEERHARLWGIHAALQAARPLLARFEQQLRVTESRELVVKSIPRCLYVFVDDCVGDDSSGSSLLRELRATCGLTPSNEEALRQLVQQNNRRLGSGEA